MPFLSPGVYPQNVSFGSLDDPIESALGWTKVNMKVLDMVSALLPMSWFVMTILTDDLVLWTKCILVNCILLLGKGLFGWITVVPDSGGWANCKERLGTAGLASMRAEIGSPADDFSSVFWNTLAFELKDKFGVLV